MYQSVAVRVSHNRDRVGMAMGEVDSWRGGRGETLVSHSAWVRVYTQAHTCMAACWPRDQRPYV